MYVHNSCHCCVHIFRGFLLMVSFTSKKNQMTSRHLLLYYHLQPNALTTARQVLWWVHISHVLFKYVRRYNYDNNNMIMLWKIPKRKRTRHVLWYYIIISYDSRLSAGYISRQQSDDHYKSIIQRYA